MRKKHGMIVETETFAGRHPALLARNIKTFEELHCTYIYSLDLFRFDVVINLT